ncbi:MAG: aminotransferase class I/II-fold pyridoxal phosphate-dependent enzyme, partial [Gemmatimonadales bacterium]
MPEKIWLSTPHLGTEEQALVADAFASNWIAPLGPHVDAFEREFAEVVGSRHAVALSSGTAALHLGLICTGIGAGDEVAVSTLTFAASAYPVRYVGATPVFIDSERESWNLDPGLLGEWLATRSKRGRV